MFCEGRRKPPAAVRWALFRHCLSDTCPLCRLPFAPPRTPQEQQLENMPGTKMKDKSAEPTKKPTKLCETLPSQLGL